MVSSSFTISSAPCLSVLKCGRTEVRKMAGPPCVAVYTEEMNHARGGTKRSCYVKCH